MKTDHDNNKIYLIVVILLQLIIIVFTGHLKQGFHVDEIFSFVFANSYENPKFDQGMYNTWFQPEYFSDMVKVSASHRFSFKTTYQNQTRDVHPPLYYFLLHTVCSIFPENFSIWFGLIINIALFVICNLFVYLIGVKLFNNFSLALIPVIVWGFSAGALSTVIFIRMYMLLTSLVVITFYLHILLFTNDTSRAFPIPIFLFTFMGIMTHYYYIVYIFYLAVTYCVYLIIQENWHQLVKYVSALSLAIIAGILFYPSMLEHIFMSYRGQEAFNAISIFSNYSQAIHSFYGLISAQQFSGVLSLIILVLLMLYFLKVVRRLIMTKNNELSLNEALLCRRKRGELSLKKYFENNYLIITLLMTTYLMFATLAIISPYQSTRYLYVIYPFVSILAIFFTIKSLELFTNNKRNIISIVLLLFMILNVLSLNNGNIDFLYPGYNDVLSIADTYSDFTCVFITDRLWTLRSNVLELAKFQETIFITAGAPLLFPIIENFDRSGKGIILYIDNIQNQEKILEFAIQYYDLENYKVLYKLDFNSIYFIY
jgi:hypothetical protein